MMSAGILSQVAGGVHLALGQPDLAARLIGGSDQALSILHVDRHPCDVPEYDRIVSGLRGSLGRDDCDRLHQAGRSMPLDDAVKLAFDAVLAPDAGR